jgi:hypothetical protein
MKFILIFLISLFLHLSVIAQKSGLKYNGIIQAGLLHGAMEPSWQLQLINGVKFKTFSFGIGLGLDQYHIKTIPVFLDARKSIFDKVNTPFVYADFGTNFPSEKKSSDMWGTREFEKGRYYDLGIGHLWGMNKGGSFLVSIGYTQKRITENHLYSWAPRWESIDYTLRRLSLKAGLRF